MAKLTLTPNEHQDIAKANIQILNKVAQLNNVLTNLRANRSDKALLDEIKTYVHKIDGILGLRD
jgi:hypothetical protein